MKTCELMALLAKFPPNSHVTICHHGDDCGVVASVVEVRNNAGPSIYADGWDRRNTKDETVFVEGDKLLIILRHDNVVENYELPLYESVNKLLESLGRHVAAPGATKKGA